MRCAAPFAGLRVNVLLLRLYFPLGSLRSLLWDNSYLNSSVEPLITTISSHYLRLGLTLLSQVLACSCGFSPRLPRKSYFEACCSHCLSADTVPSEGYFFWE